MAKFFNPHNWWRRRFKPNSTNQSTFTVELHTWRIANNKTQLSLSTTFHWQSLKKEKKRKKHEHQNWMKKYMYRSKIGTIYVENTQTKWWNQSCSWVQRNHPIENWELWVWEKWKPQRIEKRKPQPKNKMMHLF